MTSAKDNSPRLLRRGREERKFLSFLRVTLRVPEIDELYFRYCEVAHRLESCGKLDASKRLKAIYGIALRYSAGLSFKPLEWTKSDKMGFPSCIHMMKPYLKGTPDQKRAALTILQLYKLINCEGKPSLSSITDVYMGEKEPKWLPKFVETAAMLFPASQLPRRLKSMKASLHISGKNGPNGPMVGTAHVDRKSICGTNIESSVKKMSLLERPFNNDLDSLLFETQIACFDEFKHPRRRPTHSRLRVKHEPGGKARVFAIVDIFSQSALKPFHEFLMRWLKRRKTDGTSDHSKAAKQSAEWTKDPNCKIWSFDLTTATDRFPLFLTEIVMKQVFGEEIQKLWSDIIQNREFLTPDEKEYVKFNAGQPLGALSSWAAFAVTHHILLLTAARLEGKSISFRDYRIIGDDIVIAKHASVAQRYIQMMSDLSVPFSSEKSVLPEQCNGGNACELAKRLFVDGTEITPVPPEAILDGLASPSGMKVLIEQGISRGYTGLCEPRTVQSILSCDEEFAAITFPLSGASTPLLEELRRLSGVREVSPNSHELKGIDQRWFFWNQGWKIPESYGFKWILKSFLTREVNSAISRCNRLREDLFNLAWSGDIDGYQGGDWRPRMNEEGRALDLLITCMSRRYGEALYELYEGTDENQDLYRILGKLHSILKPEDIFGRQNFLSEKDKTKVYLNHLIKDCIRIRNEGEEAFIGYTNE